MSGKLFQASALFLTAILASGCISSGGPQATATPAVAVLATIQPTPTEKPTATPEPVTTPVLQITPTPAPQVPEISSVGAGMESALNSLLSQRGADHRLTLSRLEYNSGPGTMSTRIYYQGDVTAIVSEGGQSNLLRLAVTVKRTYSDEEIFPTYTVTSSKTVAGRTMTTYSDGNVFKTSIKCYGGAYYAYAEKSGTSSLLPEDVFAAMAASCPE